MSTITTAITTINASDLVSASRSTINTNTTLRHTKNIRLLVDADSPYTIVEGDDCVICDSTAAVIQVYLPLAANFKHRTFTVLSRVVTGGGAETFPTGANLINGGSAGPTLYSAYDSATFICDGTGWIVIAQTPV
jgi:hypothetical protein